MCSPSPPARGRRSRRGWRWWSASRRWCTPGVSTERPGPTLSNFLISIPVASSEGDALENAVRAAVNDVLDHAIAFVPTVVGVLDARVVGNHIYILLLFADDDGAAIMKRLTGAGADEL